MVKLRKKINFSSFDVVSKIYVSLPEMSDTGNILYVKEDRFYK